MATITPINAGDNLDMGVQNAEIDLTNFPEKKLMPLNDNDLLLINDSQDSNEAKKIKYGTLKSNIHSDDGNDLQAVTDNGDTTTNGANGGKIELKTRTFANRDANLQTLPPNKSGHTNVGASLYTNSTNLFRATAKTFGATKLLADGSSTFKGNMEVIDKRNIGLQRSFERKQDAALG